MLTDEEIDDIVNWQLRQSRGNIARQMVQSFDISDDLILDCNFIQDGSSWPVPRQIHNLDYLEKVDTNTRMIEELEEINA